MIDILASPILFPSDMDSSKLTADPNFKLPEPMNWTDHDDCCIAMLDKTMGSLAEFIKLEPVEGIDIQIYSIFLGEAILPKTTYCLDQKIDNDYTQRLALLSLAQSMIHAYTIPLPSPINMDNQDKNMDENNDEQQNALWISLRSALDVVKKDLEPSKQDSLYSGDDLPCNDVPDLVHSICSSSLQSLVDDHTLSTSPVLLESNVSSHLDYGYLQQKTTIAANNNLPSSNSTLDTTQQMDDNKNDRTFKNWLAKMKQNCVNSVSNTSRKLRQWIKN